MAELPMGHMDVVVAYSPAAGEVRECTVSVPANATVAQALQASGLETVGAQAARCGLWGRACDPHTRLHPGDRVELYRSLQVDPKVARRERFAQQGAGRSGLFAKRRPNSKAGY